MQKKFRKYIHIWYEFNWNYIHFSCNNENEHMNHGASTTQTRQYNKKTIELCSIHSAYRRVHNVIVWNEHTQDIFLQPPLWKKKFNGKNSLTSKITTNMKFFWKKYDSNRFGWMKTMTKPHLRKNSPAKNAKYEKNRKFY